MTEADARALLRDCDGFCGLEVWIAGRQCQAVSGGWIVTGELQGWRLRIEVTVAGLWITISASGGAPAVWLVTE
ncbi:hypothetical protein [Dankookia sp. P2]|uniref:hypothetical protein n=1 Tax=Dankookia sp. P2 TaxID=3423955 RepID=UPI003D676EE4